MAFASSSSSVIRSTRQLVTPVLSAKSLSRGKRAVINVTRPYSAAAALAETPSLTSSNQSFQPSPASSSSSSSSSSSFPRSSYSSKSPNRYIRTNERKITSEDAQKFLTNLLSLPSNKQFSKELSLQILTHKSYRYSYSIRHSRNQEEEENQGIIGNEPHNSRLSFIGRRVFSTYLSIFIHDAFSNKNSNSNLKLDAIDFLKGKSLEDRLDGLRDTRNLGRLVAPNWKIGEVVRWDRNETSRESGDLKILGMAVESILGGIYNEFGSPAAQRAFHTLILPHFIPQLKDPRLIEQVLNQKDQVEKSGKGILRL